MTNEQVLEQQVEALEKLLQLKQAVIEELEAKVQRLQNPYSGGINAPSIWNIPYHNTCPDGTPHQYPSIWGGSCSKCGAPFCSSTPVTITSTGGTGVGGTGITITPYAQTTGYMQPVDDSYNTCQNGSVIQLASTTKR